MPSQTLVVLLQIRTVLNKPALETFLTADMIGQCVPVEIVQIDESDTTGLRLAEMGFWPGKKIELVIAAPFGDPLAYKLDNTFVALRKDEAKRIQVRSMGTAA